MGRILYVRNDEDGMFDILGRYLRHEEDVIVYELPDGTTGTAPSDCVSIVEVQDREATSFLLVRSKLHRELADWPELYGPYRQDEVEAATYGFTGDDLHPTGYEVMILGTSRPPIAELPGTQPEPVPDQSPRNVAEWIEDLLAPSQGQDYQVVIIPELGITAIMDTARRAQQDHEQRHDVQLDFDSWEDQADLIGQILRERDMSGYPDSTPSQRAWLATLTKSSLEDLLVKGETGDVLEHVI